MKISSRFQLRFLAIALTIVRACSAEAEKPADKPAVSKPAETSNGIELSPESSAFVQIATIAPQTNQIWGRRIPARVTLQVAARANVGAVIEGRVEQVLVRPGDVVQAGQPLIQIHSVGGGQARAEAEAAQARLEAAEENLRRYKAMTEKGVATELEKYEAELHVREAKINVERTRGANTLIGTGNGVQYAITAPTNGVVLNISVSRGSALQPGNDVIEIGDPSKVWIEAEVSEDEATNCSRGKTAVIELPRGQTTVPAKIETISPQVDPVTRRRHIYLTPEAAPSGALTPGMLVEARLEEPRNQLLLPVEAVLIKEGEHRIVYVQQANGRLQPREVIVNTPSDGRVRVLKGLEPGERVVVKGALLVDGRSEQLL